jgi:rhodanese-related sulfurtransferase/DNA-binding transcriptional ArsR family regulator
LTAQTQSFNNSIELFNLLAIAMSSCSPKQALFLRFAEIAKALGHPHRLELLEQLGQAERSVEALAQKAGLSIANASQHLQQLRRAGLVHASRDGKFMVYRLVDDAVLEVLAALGTIAERNDAQVQQVMCRYFHDRDSLEPISRPELRNGTVTVLDVRPEDEFALGHLPAAINIPLKALEKRLSELDPSKEIVAYCRGPYCVLSYEAAATLRARGYTVRRLQDGFPEWRAAGLPVASGKV